MPGLRQPSSPLSSGPSARRRLSAVAAVLAACVTMSGCTGGGESTASAGSSTPAVAIDEAVRVHEATLTDLRESLTRIAGVSSWTVVRDPSEGECSPDSRSLAGPADWVWRTTGTWSAPISVAARDAMDAAMTELARVASAAGFGDPVMVSRDDEITAWDFAERATPGQQSHLFVSVGSVAVLKITSSCHPDAS